MENLNKIITIRAKTKVVEPKLYTIIFSVKEKHYTFQKMAYSLEQAVQSCTLNADLAYRTPLSSEIWRHYEMTMDEIKSQLKRLS